MPNDLDAHPYTLLKREVYFNHNGTELEVGDFVFLIEPRNVRELNGKGETVIETEYNVLPANRQSLLLMYEEGVFPIVGIGIVLAFTQPDWVLVMANCEPHAVGKISWIPF